MPETEIGHVADFFARPVVAGVKLTGSLKVGDSIHIVGHTTDLAMAVESLQINNINVQQASSGDEVGIKVMGRVRQGDKVYKVTP